MSSGSRRADRAVDPTRSQNITVRWRRSPSSRGTGSIAGRSGTKEAGSSSAMARSNLRRCPRRTPRSLRSCSVRSRTTERSTALSAKRWAYYPSPIDASHSAMPVMARFHRGCPQDHTIKGARATACQANGHSQSRGRGGGHQARPARQVHQRTAGADRAHQQTGPASDRDTSNPQGRLLSTLLAAIAEFERELTRPSLSLV